MCEIGGHGRIDLEHGGSGLEDVLICDRQWKLSAERQLAREHLEENDSQGIQVGCGRRVLALRLLGRDVLRGADDRAVLRQHGLVGRARDAEVGDLQRAVVAHEEVLRFDVPVHDSQRMGGGEAVEGLARIRRGVVGCERRAVADDLLERSAVDVLHRDERLLVGDAVVVDHDDVGMVERGDGRRLAAESLDERGVGERRREQLQGHEATEPAVAGEQHLGHPARAQARLDLVAAREHPRAGSRRGRLLHAVSHGNATRPITRIRRTWGAARGTYGDVVVTPLVEVEEVVVGVVVAVVVVVAPGPLETLSCTVVPLRAWPPVGLCATTAPTG